MPSSHAILPPSAAHRWLECAPSARIEADLPDRRTGYTDEGTLAHALCALNLKWKLGLDTSEERKTIAALRMSPMSAEMKEAAKDYSDLVWGKLEDAKTGTPDARLFVETLLDLRAYIPDGFGTSDAVIIADGTMEVVDFKYGEGVRVESERNPQMMIYALGAYALYSADYAIDTVRMTIVQPRLGNVSEYDIAVSALCEWGESVLRPGAAKAFRGEGEQRPGMWCRFCKAKGSCAALAEASLSAAKGDPALLSDEGVAECLRALPMVRMWAAAVEEHALSKALGGTKYKGFKLVEGRSVRRISDPVRAGEALAAHGFADSQVWKPAELRGVTELEKALGRKLFGEILGQFVTKPAGKPALVPESDRREEYSPAKADFGRIMENDPTGRDFPESL